MKRLLTLSLLVVAALGAMAQKNVSADLSMNNPSAATVTGDAKPLGRGLMALSLTGAKMGTGNLVSWRAFASDSRQLKFKLFRGTSATTQMLKIRNVRI